MKKIAIITIYNSNYGNRLQNYALQESLKKLNCDVTTIRNVSLLNKKKNTFEYILRNIKYIFKREDFVDCKDREMKFQQFNRYINFTKRKFNWFNIKKFNNYDYFIIGSDQVWNPYLGRLTQFDLATFTEKKKISYAASFGVSSLNNTYNDLLKKELSKFDYISVREEKGAEIIKNTGLNKNVEVLIDPTMLLTKEEWNTVIKKPNIYNGEKYILTYFLGKISDEIKERIDRFAKDNNCIVINLLDKNSSFFLTGPSEFLWLEKNAYLICTDSFHSSVFAFLFDKPFVIFDRDDNMKNMSSRLETLLSKFKLKNRKFNGKEINIDNLNHNYSEAYEILKNERKKSEDFLKKALEIK